MEKGGISIGPYYINSLFLAKKTLPAAGGMYFLNEPISGNDSWQMIHETCNPKMIMSCLAKMKMSSFGGIIMLFGKGEHYGQRGHTDDASEGIKAATCH